jgi:hypothetical protein
MEKSEFADYLRGRQMKRSGELSDAIGVSRCMFEKWVASISDDDIIDSYRICAHCGKEWITRTEMENLIRDGTDPNRVLDEIPSGHE